MDFGLEIKLVLGYADRAVLHLKTVDWLSLEQRRNITEAEELLDEARADSTTANQRPGSLRVLLTQAWNPETMEEMYARHEEVTRLLEEVGGGTRVSTADLDRLDTELTLLRDTAKRIDFGPEGIRKRGEAELAGSTDDRDQPNW